MTRRPPKSTLFPYTPLFRSTLRDRYAKEPSGLLARLFRTHHLRCADRKSTRLNSSHPYISYFLFFFFNDTAPTEIYPLPLHAALPIYSSGSVRQGAFRAPCAPFSDS